MKSERGRAAKPEMGQRIIVIELYGPVRFLDRRAALATPQERANHQQ